VREAREPSGLRPFSCLLLPVRKDPARESASAPSRSPDAVDSAVRSGSAQGVDASSPRRRADGVEHDSEGLPVQGSRSHVPSSRAASLRLPKGRKERSTWVGLAF
jgi:hypothetical protein